MTISAFLLTALLSVVSFTLNASSRVDRRTESTERVSRVFAALSRDLEAIAPLRWAAPKGGFVFAGSPDRLLFARQERSDAGVPEDKVIILQASGNRLLRSEAALSSLALSEIDINAAAPQDILDGRYQLRFAYFSRLPDGREALTDGWADPAQMPVAIQLSLSDGKAPPIASARVRIRVDAEPGCAAPTKAVCSLAATPIVDGDPAPGVETQIDADDALGWGRYAQ